jgi:3-oxoacyl-[acyl-carrier-protein] synthase-3
VEADKGLLEKRKIKAEEIDCIICATVTPDMMFPSTANVIADKIGAVNAWGFDLSAACSGFLFALSTGSKFIETGSYKKVLVFGADKMSAITDYTDRSTCIIFGDGAGVVLLEPSTEPYGVMDSILKSDGSGRHVLRMKAGGSEHPASIETVTNKEHFLYQEGKTVFKSAVKNMADVAVEIMERNHLEGKDIQWLIPHQANRRIIEATAERMELPMEKATINIHKYGNTTSGTIPLCLWEWEKEFKKGDNLILTAFGGGFTWGAIFIKWAY